MSHRFRTDASQLQRVGFIVFTQRLSGAQGAEKDPLDQITGAIIGAGIRIHQKLGPGLLESVYEIILARDLARAGFHIERQTPITFEFEGTLFHEGFRPDLIVNGSVVVELKAAEAMNPIYARQLLTYMKILELRRGLVMNFGLTTMRAGIERVILQGRGTSEPLCSSEPLCENDGTPHRSTSQ